MATTRAGTSRVTAALSARPGSSSSSASPFSTFSPLSSPDFRLHRRGKRSVAARYRRTSARLARLWEPDDSETESHKIPSFGQAGPPAGLETASPEIPISGQASATNTGRSGAHGPLGDDPLLRGGGSHGGAGGTLLKGQTVVESCSSRVVNEEVVASESPNGVRLRDNSSPSRSGQSGPPTPSISDTFSVFHLNPQGIGTEAKRAEFDALLQQIQQPSVVAVTETWLTRKTKEWTFSGYTRVSRLDRRVGRPDRGGIAVFVRDDFRENVVHIGDSPVDERSWHIVHCDCGPVLLCVWYRPPNRGELDSIRRFDSELEMYSANTVATLAVGDFNVHNVEWLRFSNGESEEGTALEHVCSQRGLRQHVKGPTRGDYLLDLVLSNFASGVRCKVIPGIREDDHDGVLATISVSIPAACPVRRQVYDFRNANWEKLQRLLAQTSWGDEIRTRSADGAAAWVTSKVLALVDDCVPSKWITDKSYAHPWINTACRDALRNKHAARGTEEFAAARDNCSQVFLQAYLDHVVKTRDTLKTLGPGSRGWWKVANSLLTKSGVSENIPALQRADGSWAMSPEERANELASTFRAKAQLPPTAENAYSDLLGHPEGAQQSGFLRIRVRTVLKLLRDLDEHSGTGPDRLPARILKRCASELALPVTLLARKLLAEARWPECWRTHWVYPLHKKKSRADPKNYRGVHLTAQLSKVVERTIGTVFIPWAEKMSLYGPNQYAYSKGKGYKDTLIVNVCNWILLMEQGFMVGVYCSDVSGAFDRVERDRLCDKLRVSGLHHQVVAFLASWLEDRVSKVVLGGAHSPDEPLINSVFQGTVLGSPLRNLFYSDARRSVTSRGFTDTVFADDFNCWRPFPVPHDDVPAAQATATHELERAQHELHLWGQANRVIFDPSKESFHLLHRRFWSGENFKILGVIFDPALLMHAAACEIATEAGWRLQALLKVRRFFTTPELFQMYKAQVLSYIESSTPGLYHAAPTVLNRIDRVQRRFLRELGFSEVEALRRFRLAPLPCRRDMAMLGALHKVTLGLASAQMQALFPVIGHVLEAYLLQRLRRWRPLHNRQLQTPCSRSSTEQMKRSLFGVARCYNLLPQDLVDTNSVKLFQRRLQWGLRKCADSGLEDWKLLFSDVWRRGPRQNFDVHFC